MGGKSTDNHEFVTEHAFYNQKKYLEALFTNTTDAIVLFDKHNCIININDNFSRLFGYTLDEIKGMDVDDVLEMGKKNSANHYFTNTVLSGNKIEQEGTRYNKNGEPIEVLIKGIPVIIEREFSGGYGIYTDITDRKQKEMLVREREEELNTIYKNAPLIMMLVDKETRVKKINNYASHFTGKYPEQLLDHRGGEALNCYNAITNPKGCGFSLHCANCIIRNTVIKTLNTGENYHEVEASMKYQGQNSVYTLYLLVSTSRILIRKEPMVLVSIQDITDRKLYEDQLEFLTLHDTLTGLYNRAHFEQELHRLDEKKERPVSIISADIDGLKLVNDTLGHSEGDKLIKACSEILQNSIRKDDILARTGGDEFSIILPGTTHEDTDKVVERIYHQINSYNDSNSGIPVKFSIGAATCSNPSISLSETLKQADNKMYKHKSQNNTGRKPQVINTILTALQEKGYTNQELIDELKKL